MVNVAKIKSQIERFLADQVSLGDFNEWLARNTWNVTREQPNSQARILAGRIELALAEYSEGHLSLRDLRKRLAAIVSAQRLAANEDL